MDPEKVQRLIRAYRVAVVVGDARRGHRKLKGALDDHAQQSDFLMDGAELVERIRTKQVRASDVRNGARRVVNAAPKIYQAVARHVRKQKNAKA